MLKPKEKMLAELMCAEPSLMFKDYAEIIGVCEKTVYTYRQKPEFQEYLKKLCEKRFADMERLALSKLKEEVENNNFKAIQYVLDGNGYKAKEEHEMKMDAKIEVDYGED